MIRSRFSALNCPPIWLGLALCAPFAFDRWTDGPTLTDQPPALAGLAASGWIEPIASNGWPLVYAGSQTGHYHNYRCSKRPVDGHPMEITVVPRSLTPCPICRPPRVATES